MTAVLSLVSLLFLFLLLVCFVSTPSAGSDLYHDFSSVRLTGLDPFSSRYINSLPFAPVTQPGSKSLLALPCSPPWQNRKRQRRTAAASHRLSPSQHTRSGPRHRNRLSRTPGTSSSTGHRRCQRRTLLHRVPRQPQVRSYPHLCLRFRCRLQARLHLLLSQVFHRVLQQLRARSCLHLCLPLRCSLQALLRRLLCQVFHHALQQPRARRHQHPCQLLRWRL